jgi:hypothetical protein
MVATMTRPQPPVPPPVKPNTNAKKIWTTVQGPSRSTWKLGIYGSEGIGKSSLAASCHGAIFADIERSMEDLDVTKVEGVNNWEDLRSWVQSWNKGIYGIDSITRAEDWAAEFVIKTKKSNDGLKAADSLEDFKYKAGLTFVCDEFRRLLGDIEAANRRGASCIMVAHSRVNRFKNPDGSDYVRYEPRLIDDTKASNMLQWIQFLDHLIYVDQDTNVNKGKAVGCGSRTLYLNTSPSRLSKTRGLSDDPVIYQRDSTVLWDMLGVKNS